ncbi:hypothetical protein ACQQ2N_03215 [Dokdonella sp. MW10]|uniref:hypothetical protein n=1 Tax=Dokdonella sp. MW10 TaxID=2992926 RepID=UPI003F81DDC3
MKNVSMALGLGYLIIATGCSGFMTSVRGGSIVSPQHLAQYRGIGSISTLWYLGSDTGYHYFAHYVKVSTGYRVRRQDLAIPDEFAYRSRPATFAGAASYWQGL